jgi:DNA (cytosine-5)-methyltransferase 1
MSRRKILVADLLCGAGGSSTGADRALRKLGLEMDLVAVNHWPTAIETHSRNHPTARHYVQDIATVRPHLLVPEGYLDLLMASPTCTHHSVARGGKPTSDQQRSDPWHIITWLTELRVKRIIIENVWEFTNWGPVDRRTGRPVESRKGEYFFAWINALKSLGFDVEWRKLNAADYGDATTRQRFILMGRSDGKKISWPMPTHARRPDEGLSLFPTMKPWRPAREIIDWNIKGRSIFDRKKPLAAKTLQRIYAGAVKFGWPEPYIVVLRNHMAAQGIDAPLPTIAANGGHIGIAQVVPFVLSQGAGGEPRQVADPVPTIPTKGAHALISPYYGSGSGETCSDAGEPLPTVTSKGRFGMVVPVTNGSGGPSPRSVDEPLPTMTTAKGGEFAMVVPLTHAGGLNRVQDPGHDPLPTVTGANRGELACAEGVEGFDILFRMLEPTELAAAMGLAGYEFAGTKTERIKQIGNAVSASKMEACVEALMADAVRPAREAKSVEGVAA